MLNKQGVATSRFATESTIKSITNTYDEQLAEMMRAMFRGGIFCIDNFTKLVKKTRPVDWLPWFIRQNFTLIGKLRVDSDIPVVLNLNTRPVMDRQLFLNPTAEAVHIIDRLFLEGPMLDLTNLYGQSNEKEYVSSRLKFAHRNTAPTELSTTLQDIGPEDIDPSIGFEALRACSTRQFTS